MQLFRGGSYIMSKVIFGMCDGNSGLTIAEEQHEDNLESLVVVNTFSDGSHASAALSEGEIQALHLSLSRYLGIPLRLTQEKEFTQEKE